MWRSTRLFSAGLAVTVAAMVLPAYTVGRAHKTLAAAQFGVRDVDALFMLWEVDESRWPGLGRTASIMASDRIAKRAEFVNFTAYDVSQNRVLTVGDERTRVRGGSAEPTFFDRIGVNAARGRLLKASDGSDVAVLSYATWSRVAGQSEDIVGRTLTYGSRSLLIVGVLPADFDLGEDIGIWFPLSEDDVGLLRGAGRVMRFPSLRIVGRLAGGVEFDRAVAVLGAAAGTMRAEEDVLGESWRPELMPLRDFVAGDTAGVLYALALVLTGFLLIGAASCSTIALVQAERMKRELMTRRVFGATTSQLIMLASRRLVLPGAFGAACAVVIGRTFVPIDVVTYVWPTSLDMPRSLQTEADALGALLVLIGALAGGIGVVRLALYLGSNRPADRQQRRATTSLAIPVQVTVAVVALLATSDIAATHMAAVEASGMGAAAEWTTVRVDLPRWEYGTDQARLAFFHSIIDRLGGGPQPLKITCSTRLPTGQGDFHAMTLHSVAGRPADRVGDVDVNVSYSVVCPGFFEAVGLEVVAGRDFRSTGSSTQPLEIIVNTPLAATFGGATEVVGERVEFLWNGDRVRAQIIGVVQPMVGRTGLAIREAEVFFHLDQYPLGEVRLLVRDPSGAGRARDAVAQALDAVDPGQRGEDWQQLDRVIETALAARLRYGLLLAGLSTMSLVLVALGVFGGVSSRIAVRWRTLAIRAMLGATPIALVRNEAAWAIGLVLCGALLGGVAYAGWIRQWINTYTALVDTDFSVAFAAFAVLTTAVFAALIGPTLRIIGLEPQELLARDH